MRNATLVVLVLATTIFCASDWAAAGSVPFSDHASSYGDHPMPRVRSADSTIAPLIARAYALSATFRRVVDMIDETDGIVYVEPGRCRRVRACMPQKMTVAGPHRILRIVVDLRKAADCDVMASIGHELWHALEVLRETSIRSDAALHFFYMTEGHKRLSVESTPTVWETAAAQKAGFDVLTELLSDKRPNRNSCEAI